MNTLKRLFVRPSPCANGDSLLMADKNGDGVIYSSEPDSIIMMHCGFLCDNPILSKEARINLFIEQPNVSTHSSLIADAKEEYNAIFDKIKSLYTPIFTFVNSSSEAEIVIKIDTIHKKINKTRRRLIRTKWFTTDNLEQVWVKGIEVLKNSNTLLYNLHVNGKSDGLKVSEYRGQILNSSGFLTECAYLITLKSAIITL